MVRDYLLKLYGMAGMKMPRYVTKPTVYTLREDCYREHDYSQAFGPCGCASPIPNKCPYKL